MKTVGIALSGGGTRGMVHVGALQALEEHGISPDVISGTSAGAIVGVLYANGYTPAELLEFSRENTFLKMMSLRLPKKGFVKHTHLMKQLKKHIPENSFGALKKSLYVAIANLNTGLAEFRSEGPLWEIIVASSSVPIIFEPIELDGELFVDGGLVKNMPASILQDKADVILGVNLVPQTRVGNDEISNIMGVANRCFNLSVLNNIMPDLKYCDVVIEPPEIHHYSRYNFSQMKKMYEIGYSETIRMMPRIKAAIGD